MSDSMAGEYPSSRWFNTDDVDGFLQRSALKVQGFEERDFTGRPVIGICNNWSELTRCHIHFKLMAEAVKRGVWQAGGFPREFPSMSLGADLMHTPFMHRNLMAMEVEQNLRNGPLDAVVLMGACDETIPAMLMAVASCDIPAIMLPGGPGLNGRWHGEAVGSSTDCHRYYSEYRAGKITAKEWRELEENIEHSPGHCMTMGTASTMACISEALGMALPGSAAVPAVDARRMRLAQAAGRRAVELVQENLRPSQIITRESLENAIRILSAIAGSTNAVVHLLALAGRLGIPLSLDVFDSCARTTPIIVNLKPCGEYLMEDLFYAGGVPAVMKELDELLNAGALTVTGRTVRENVATAKIENPDVVRSRDNPIKSGPALVVLSGNLAPDGAILKQAAASPQLLSHSGPAVVFDSYGDFVSRIDDPALSISAESVVVIRNIGPRGGTALGDDSLATLTLPRKLLARGVRDMVRVSDGRMSGTAYGTVALHVSPEAASGGPLAVVKDGDMIRLDAENRRLDVEVSDEELRSRLVSWVPRRLGPSRGYARLYIDHVVPIHQGCDFDFLRDGNSEERETALSAGGVSSEPLKVNRHPSK